MFIRGVISLVFCLLCIVEVGLYPDESHLSNEQAQTTKTNYIRENKINLSNVLVDLADEINCFFKYEQRGIIANLTKSEMKFEEITEKLNEFKKENSGCNNDAILSKMIKISIFFQGFCQDKAEAVIAVLSDNENKMNVALVRNQQNLIRSNQYMKDILEISENIFKGEVRKLPYWARKFMYKKLKICCRLELEKYINQLNENKEIMMLPSEWPLINMFYSLVDVFGENNELDNFIEASKLKL